MSTIKRAMSTRRHTGSSCWYVCTRLGARTAAGAGAARRVHSPPLCCGEEATSAAAAAKSPFDTRREPRMHFSRIQVHAFLLCSNRKLSYRCAPSRHSATLGRRIMCRRRVKGTHLDSAVQRSAILPLGCHDFAALALERCAAVWGRACLQRRHAQQQGKVAFQRCLTVQPCRTSSARLYSPERHLVHRIPVRARLVQLQASPPHSWHRQRRMHS